MLLLPDISTAQLDPFRAAKALNVNCFVHERLRIRTTIATRRLSTACTERRIAKPSLGCGVVKN
jgi:glutamine synthetase